MTDVKKSTDAVALENEIRSTRVGGFGSSDAEMIYNIGLRGSLTNGDRERIAVYLGLQASPEFSNEYTERGKRREQEVLEFLRKEHTDRTYTSNPLYENKELTVISGIRCFTHIDIVEEREFSFFSWYEVKSTKESLYHTALRYRSQLWWHLWCMKDCLGSSDGVYLLHYNEDGTDVFNKFYLSERHVTIDENYLTWQKYIIKGLEIIKSSLDEVRESFLPKKVVNTTAETTGALDKTLKIQASVYRFLVQQKAVLDKWEQVKKVIQAYMIANDIKKWKTNFFSFSLVSDGESSKFDSKRFKLEHPDLYSEYLVKSVRSGYLKVDLVAPKDELFLGSEVADE